MLLSEKARQATRYQMNFQCRQVNINTLTALLVHWL